MELETLKNLLDKDLSLLTLSGRSILDRFRVVDDKSRKTAPYLDHRYAPFYYYLGKHIQPKNVMEIGFNLGLLSGSFLISCKTVKNFFGFKLISNNFIPTRLGKSNIKMVFKGNKKFFEGNLYENDFFDEFGKNLWDLIIINDENVYDQHLEYLEIVWPQISENGLIVAEYIHSHKAAGDAFLAFCESKNRQPLIFKTRYGTGIVQK